jgi:hypothetical protein
MLCRSRAKGSFPSFELYAHVGPCVTATRLIFSQGCRPVASGAQVVTVHFRGSAEWRYASNHQSTSLKLIRIIQDLCRRPRFIEPFLIASLSRNPKYVGPGISGLQRLAVSKALPKSRLKEVLDAMKECSNLGSTVLFVFTCLS